MVVDHNEIDTIGKYQVLVAVEGSKRVVQFVVKRS